MASSFIPDQIENGYDFLQALRKWERKRDPAAYQRRFERSTAGRRLRNSQKQK